MNMFKPTQAKSVRGYIRSVPEERREMIERLHAFIKRSVPKLKPYFATNMLGYGTFPYRNHRGEVIRWPVVALADRKRYVSIYVCATERGNYIAEMFRRQLGKVTVGRSCISFKRMEDINLPALRRVLLKAQRSPGLVFP